MVLNKLSPGCCCGDVCPDCEGTLPTEFDFTTSGLSDTTDCNICDTLNGSFTVGSPAHFAQGQFPNNSDYPIALSFCRWFYSFGTSTGLGVTYPSCSWSPTPRAGFSCSSEATFTLYAFILARFKMSDTSYKWRLIVNYSMSLSCNCAVWGGGPPEFCCSDSQVFNNGWFWEHSSSANTCTLSGSESWSLTVPSFNFSVTCNGLEGGLDDVLNETLSFSDFCSGSLSLSSNPTS